MRVKPSTNEVNPPIANNQMRLTTYTKPSTGDLSYADCNMSRFAPLSDENEEARVCDDRNV